MNIGASKAGLILASFALLTITASVPRIAFCQETSDNSETNARKDPQTSDKPKLGDVTRVSTEETARQAAKEKATDDKASSDKPSSAIKPNQGKANYSPVSELQPAVKTKGDQSATDKQSARGADPKLKKIHGSVHGTTGAAAREGGAEIGADAKSGKTHVYVETGRTENSQPH